MSKQKWFLMRLTIIVTNIYLGAYAYRVLEVNGVETLLALENEAITIECKTDMPMAYCGFKHPNGKRYSISDRAIEAGHCAINRTATKDDTGEWRCHIGGKATGVEEMQTIQVRVVDHIAAVQSNISAVHGKQVTLACVTTQMLMPLSYCRFEPPNGQPFSINQDVNATNPILNRYYFPNNKSLDRGDCAVTIQKVKYEDVGTWTCGAGFDDGNEHIDVITLKVVGLYTMSTASATGIAFGTFGVAGFLIMLGVYAWKKRSLLGNVQRDTPEPLAHELEHLRSPPSERNIPLVVVEPPSEAGTPPSEA